MENLLILLFCLWDTLLRNRRILSILSCYWRGLFLSWENMSPEGWGFPRSMDLRGKNTESHAAEPSSGCPALLPRWQAVTSVDRVLGSPLEVSSSHGPSGGQPATVQSLLPRHWVTTWEEKYTMFVVSVTWECVIYHAGKSFLSHLKSVSQAFSSDSDKLFLPSHSQHF